MEITEDLIAGYEFSLIGKDDESVVFKRDITTNTGDFEWYALTQFKEDSKVLIEYCHAYDDRPGTTYFAEPMFEGTIDSKEALDKVIKGLLTTLEVEEDGNMDTDNQS